MVVLGLGRAFLCLSVCLSVSPTRLRVRASGGDIIRTRLQRNLKRTTYFNEPKTTQMVRSSPPLFSSAPLIYHPSITPVCCQGRSSAAAPAGFGALIFLRSLYSLIQPPRLWDSLLTTWLERVSDEKPPP